jgi:hypothetical protein
MDDLSLAVEKLLTISRSEIADNKPHEALAALLHAVRLTRGESAIFDILSEAKIRASEEMDAREAESSIEKARQITNMLLQQNTMLFERGEEEILKDAFEDGSSVVCTRCHGLVARVRWEAHNTLWCPELAQDDDDMNMGD